MSENSSNSIAYKIHKIVFVMDKLADSSLFYQTGLTLSQYLIILAIIENPGLNQIEIADRHELTQAAVSRQIDVLKNKDLIHVKKNETNKRENLLFPTLMGKEVFKEASKILNDEYDTLYSCFSLQEKKEFEENLDKLLYSVCGKK